MTHPSDTLRWIARSAYSLYSTRYTSDGAIALRMLRLDEDDDWQWRLEIQITQSEHLTIWEPFHRLAALAAWLHDDAREEDAIAAIYVHCVIRHLRRLQPPDVPF